MDLFLIENSLEECLTFLVREGYNIIQQPRGKKNNYTLLYLCHETNNFLMQKFDSIGDLHIQLNMNNQVCSPLAIGIFDGDINKTSKYSHMLNW
jgi:hypothetical protein